MSRTRKSVERENTLAVAKGQGLDLTDRVPEELGMEVCDTVQQEAIKTIPKKKKKRKKAKQLSEEALQIAEKRREAKGKGEKKDIPI